MLDLLKNWLKREKMEQYIKYEGTIMKKYKIFICFLIVFSLSSSLFANEYNTWVGLSGMGDAETTLSGGGGGVSVSMYYFFDSQEEKMIKRVQNEATAEYVSGGDLFFNNGTIFNSTRALPVDKEKDEIKRIKLGLMTRISLLGESINAFGSGSAFFTFYSAGLGIRQIINNKLTVYEGVGFGLLSGVGSIKQAVSGSYYDSFSGQYRYVDGWKSGTISAYGYGLNLDVGVKYDFSSSLSVIGGLNIPVLFGDVYASTYYSSSYPSYNVNWYDSNYSDSEYFVFSLQPYVGVAFNY